MYSEVCLILQPVKSYNLLISTFYIDKFSSGWWIIQIALYTDSQAACITGGFWQNFV